MIRFTVPAASCHARSWLPAVCATYPPPSLTCHLPTYLPAPTSLLQGLPGEILTKLEKRDIPWERYYDMSSQVREEGTGVD
jgi:hypothetical protein